MSEHDISQTRAYEASHFLAAACRLGEGPRWHPGENLLYWLDIENGLLYRLDPESGINEPERFDLGQPCGSFAFRAGGGLVLALRDGLAAWQAESSGDLQWIAKPEEGKPNARFNDGRTDPGGRFWAGTLTKNDEPTASLYRLDPDGYVRTMETGLTISNGIGWSPDARTMYLTDTPTGTIFAYDYDVATGSIEKRREFVRVPEGAGWPDGLAVDSEGCVWSAHYAGGRITRYDPSGAVERVVRLPVANVTACAFGGPDLTTLYITTAWDGLSDGERARQPQAGDLFCIEAPVRGLAEHEYRG